MSAVPLRLISPPVIVGCLIGERASITVHPLGRLIPPYLPVTVVMGAGKGDWGSAVAIHRVIMLLSFMLIMTSLARVNLGQIVAESPPALQKVSD
jgi:hypothetical protein